MTLSIWEIIVDAASLALLTVIIFFWARCEKLERRVLELEMKQQGYVSMLRALPLDGRNQNGRKK